MTVKAKALKRVTTPAYPTLTDVECDPTLLSRRLPPGWMRSPKVARIAAAALALGAGGCGGSIGQSLPSDAPFERLTADTSENRCSNPLDIRVTGSRAIGCIYNPPVFLSEDEAFGIIAEELSKAGVSLSRREIPHKEVFLSRCSIRLGYDYRWVDGSSKLFEFRNKRQTFVLDAMDPDKQIAVEFVSKDDYSQLAGFEVGGKYMLDLSTPAKELERHIAENRPELIFRAFFFPLAFPLFQDHDCYGKVSSDTKFGRGAKHELLKNRLRKASVDNLRRQAAAFVGWLEERGVI